MEDGVCENRRASILLETPYCSIPELVSANDASLGHVCSDLVQVFDSINLVVAHYSFQVLHEFTNCVHFSGHWRNSLSWRYWNRSWRPLRLLSRWLLSLRCWSQRGWSWVLSRWYSLNRCEWFSHLSSCLPTIPSWIIPNWIDSQWVIRILVFFSLQSGC